jgi:hypothetical protein
MPLFHFFIGAAVLILLGIATIGSAGGLLYPIGVFILGFGIGRSVKRRRNAS